MNYAYVVTEGVGDLRILKRILPTPVTRHTEFVAGSGSYSAQSLATTLLAVRQRPVALVVDADTENPTMVKEQREFLRELLRQAAPDTRFAIFTAVPELEIIFFQDKTLLEQLIQHELSEAEWQAAKHDPRSFLAEPSLFDKVLDNLTEDKIRVLQQHPLLRELTAFLSNHNNGQTQV